jgi:ABC-type multidrug transport system fused ATPase/permease subunit
MKKKIFHKIKLLLFVNFLNFHLYSNFNNVQIIKKQPIILNNPLKKELNESYTEMKEKKSLSKFPKKFIAKDYKMFYPFIDQATIEKNFISANLIKRVGSFTFKVNLPSFLKAMASGIIGHILLKMEWIEIVGNIVLKISKKPHNASFLKMFWVFLQKNCLLIPIFFICIFYLLIKKSYNKNISQEKLLNKVFKIIKFHKFYNVKKFSAKEYLLIKKVIENLIVLCENLFSFISKITVSFIILILEFINIIFIRQKLDNDDEICSFINSGNTKLFQFLKVISVLSSIIIALFLYIHSLKKTLNNIFIISKNKALINNAEYNFLENFNFFKTQNNIDYFYSFIKKKNEENFSLFKIINNNINKLPLLTAGLIQIFILVIAHLKDYKEKNQLISKMENSTGVEELLKGSLVFNIMRSLILFINTIETLNNLDKTIHQVKDFLMESDSLKTVLKNLPLYYSSSKNEKNFSINGKIILKNFQLKNSNIISEPINYVFESGKVTSILGGSGSGKSSLIKAIDLNYNPKKNTVFFQDEKNNFHDIKNIDPIFFYDHVFVIDQNNYILNDTLGNNLSFDPKITREEKLAMIKMLKLESIIFTKTKKKNIKDLTLEDLDIPISSENISGGQAKRINIARLLLRLKSMEKNSPKILILDEFTGALDRETALTVENECFNIIKEQYNITTLFISHDSKQINKYSDNVIVLDNGKIIEQGTKEELLKNPNSYLFKIKK